MFSRKHRPLTQIQHLLQLDNPGHTCEQAYVHALPAYVHFPMCACVCMCAGDGMPQRDWLALVAVHSDSWLLAVAFFYAVKLDSLGR